jgi:hypothetical protein
VGARFGARSSWMMVHRCIAGHRVLAQIPREIHREKVRCVWRN